MPKPLAVQASDGSRFHVARDPRPASPAVQKAVKRITKAADRDTANLKVKLSTSRVSR
jgi:hypothetical protein